MGSAVRARGFVPAGAVKLSTCPPTTVIVIRQTSADATGIDASPNSTHDAPTDTAAILSLLGLNNVPTLSRLSIRAYAVSPVPAGR
jgi:hypothetical protein